MHESKLDALQLLKGSHLCDLKCLIARPRRHWCLHTWCHLLTLTQGFLQPFPHHGHLLSHPCVPADWAELPQRRCWADHRGGVGLPWRLGAQGSEQCVPSLMLSRIFDALCVPSLRSPKTQRRFRSSSSPTPILPIH